MTEDNGGRFFVPIAPKMFHLFAQSHAAQTFHQMSSYDFIHKDSANANSLQPNGCCYNFV